MYGEGASIRMKPGDALWPLGNGCRLVCENGQHVCLKALPHQYVDRDLMALAADHGPRPGFYYGSLLCGDLGNRIPQDVLMVEIYLGDDRA